MSRAAARNRVSSGLSPPPWKAALRSLTPPQAATGAQGDFKAALTNFR